MAGEKFYLNFISDNTGEVQIDEPFGFSSLQFDVNQKSNGYGRDIMFNSGEAMMEFGNRRNHFLDKLLYYFHFYGFEAHAQLRIKFITGENLIMDLDFYSAITDDLEYFKCKCIEVSTIQIINRRASVKVDLFSTKNIDYATDDNGNVIAGGLIDPVPTSNIILLPKALSQTSKWNSGPYENIELFSKGAKDTSWYVVNPSSNIIKSDIKGTLSWYEVTTKNAKENTKVVIQATDNMYNINVQIDIGKISYYTHVDAFGNGYVKMHLKIEYGAAQDGTQTVISYLPTYNEENQSFEQDDLHIVTVIPALNRGDKIWIFFEFEIHQTANVPRAVFAVITTIRDMNTTITANTTTYNSITKGIRVIDAFRQIVKSISGKDITAPVLDAGSLYYDSFLLNGNLMRSITNKPFYLSLEDLEKSLSQEINGDFETTDTVFFGKEEDFYQPTEIWFFDNTQFSDFTKKVNERFAINEFSFAYSTFQAQKENTLPNTVNIIHGSSKMTLPHKMVENKKEITVDWIRDAYLIEEARRKSLEITVETATQNDNDVFALDTIANTTDSKFTEIDDLYHDYIDSTRFFLRSKESPNFIALGIAVGDNFRIEAPDKNAGNYIVLVVAQSSLQLNPNAANGPGQPNESHNGNRFTKFTYSLSKANYPYKTRTTEGITNITNLPDVNGFANLRFSVRRNIENNYNRMLSTANMYKSELPIKVTFYEINKAFSCTYNGLTTIEGSNYLPTNPLLSAWVFENAKFANVDFEDFVIIRNKLKTLRGFIRCIDKTGNVIKIFPQKMTYNNLSRELNISGEGKFETMQMIIQSDNNGYITINQETSIFTDKFDWEIIDHKLSVFDNHRQRLYNPVFWDKVSINNGFAKSEEELKQLLNLL